MPDRLTIDRHDPHTAPETPTLFLMVGLPGAGKTTHARRLAAEHAALRLTPDEWHLPLLGTSLTAGGRRDVLEGRLITVALRVLAIGASVVLDFGLWGRDERSALRRLAAAVGADCHIVYLPVERDVQLARIAHRQATTPHPTFLMPADAVLAWREHFQEPDGAELAGEAVPDPPAGWPDWFTWAVDRWPTLDRSEV